ncbi:MAG: hypothetical protein H6745_22570 [Deltaproteobacteria bacterium]|nr:hypothetical protein [Deltaproteobacteria bacterium]
MRASLLALLIAAACAIAACGGASDGALPCHLNPTVPGCGADVVGGGADTARADVAEDTPEAADTETADTVVAADTETADTVVAADTAEPPPGEASCEDVRACVAAACAGLAGDEAATCSRACRAAGSVAGRAAYDAVTACVAGCAGDDDCAWGTCAVEEARCRFARSGHDDCEEIFDCFYDCSEDDDDHDDHDDDDKRKDKDSDHGGPVDPACVDACWLGGDVVSGQAALIAYLGCVETRCPSGSHGCVETLCGGYEAACDD